MCNHTLLSFRVPKSILTIFLFTLVALSCGRDLATEPDFTDDNSEATTAWETKPKDKPSNKKAIENDAVKTTESIPSLVNDFLSGSNSFIPSYFHAPEKPGVIYRMAGTFFTLLLLFAFFQILVIDRRPKSLNSRSITEKTLLISDLRILTTDFRLFKRILAVVSLPGRNSLVDDAKEKEMLAKFENLEAIDFQRTEFSKYISELESQFKGDQDVAQKEEESDEKKTNANTASEIDPRFAEIDRAILSSRMDSAIEKLTTISNKIEKDSYQSTGGLRALLEVTEPSFHNRFQITFVLSVVAFALFIYVPTFPVATLIVLGITLAVACFLISY